MELDDRVDLLHDLLDLPGELLGLLGCDVHVLHLGCVGIGLELVCLRALVFVTTEDARRNLLKDVLQEGGIRVLGMADGTLKLLELRLGGLVVELAHDGVQEVDTTESSSNDGEHGVASTI